MIKSEIQCYFEAEEIIINCDRKCESCLVYGYLEYEIENEGQTDYEDIEISESDLPF